MKNLHLAFLISSILQQSYNRIKIPIQENSTPRNFQKTINANLCHYKFTKFYLKFIRFRSFTLDLQIFLVFAAINKIKAYKRARHLKKLFEMCSYLRIQFFVQRLKGCGFRDWNFMLNENKNEKWEFVVGLYERFLCISFSGGSMNIMIFKMEKI